jgi:4-amino-4-deoxy-L-arabinose transferase-like glycosyltransferase
VPTLFFFLQAAGLALVGDSVAGARTAAALLGVCAVAVTFLFTRRLLGTATAVVAALLLAAFHYHVHFSRLSSNQIADSLAIVAVLYTLDRAMHERRPLDGLLAGAAIGLSQYFSFAGRIIPLIGLAYIAFTYVMAAWRQRQSESGIGHTRPPLSILAWLVLGAAVSYAPLAAHFTDNPQAFSTRTDQVSMFSSGWLDKAIALTGRDSLDLVFEQIRRAVFLPFQTNPGGWYINHRPFIGIPMAVVLALGLIVTTLGFWRRPYRGLAIAYWTSALGLGLTEDPSQTQRFVIASSLMAVMCAVAIVATARIALGLAEWPRTLVYGGAALAVAGLVGWNLFHYFGPKEHPLYGDANSQTATHLAYYLRAMPTGTTVYFLAPPRMFYGGFQSLPFIARGARGVDVVDPLSDGSPRPVTSGPIVFAALPERARELDVVRRWFPDGDLRGLGDPGRDPHIWVYAPRT